MSTRLLFLCSLGLTAAAQQSQSTFPLYGAGSRNPTVGLPSNDPSIPGMPHSGRWQNLDSPDSGPFTVTPRPSGSAGVSADQLRHPLTAKTLRILHKAENLIAAHDYVHAREELQKATKDRAAAPYAHSMLGQEYVRGMEFGAAVQELEQAVRLLPSNVPDHANLGYAFLMTGQLSPAEKELRRALELQPANPHTHLVLGILCYTAGARDQEAEEHLEFAARELPTAHLMLARFYQLTGRTDAADREFQTYAQLTGSADSTATRQ